MTCLTLTELKSLAVSLYNRISEYNDLECYIHFGPTFEDCKPYVDIDDKGYHLKCFERGQQIQNDVTKNTGEFLYWIFRHVTGSLSIEFEQKNRIRYQDNRRLMFSKQFELLEIIGDDFVFKCQSEINDILKNHPYDDANHTKLDLIDDFERILVDVYSQVELKIVMSEIYIEKVAANIETISQLHKTGTSNLDKFTNDLYTECRSIYSELGKIDKSIVDIEKIKNDFRVIILFAESVLDIDQNNCE